MVINKEINNNVTIEFNTYEIKTYDSLNINLNELEYVIYLNLK